VTESLIEDRFQKGEEDSMEQNGDKNDAGTVSHYPGNHYVDSQEVLTREGEGRNFRVSYTSRNGASIRMGYAVCVSDAGRWVWDLCVENPPEAPQVIYKAACVDFKLQQSLERTTNVSSKCRRT
jgi:hypothetical protein